MSAEYTSRVDAVNTFNSENAWKKRGIAMVPMRWPHRFAGYQFTCQVAVYRDDGTIAVVSGGVEMGQGLNTKVAQAVAGTLGVDLSLVKIKTTDTFIAPGNDCTGGSIGSDLAAKAAQIAAQDLLTRLDEAASVAGLVNPTWQEKVAQGYKAGLDMAARHT